MARDVREREGEVQETPEAGPLDAGSAWEPLPPVRRSWWRLGGAGRQPRKRELSLTLARIAGYIIFFALWQYLSGSVFGRVTLPPPREVWDDVVEIFRENNYWSNFTATLAIFVRGFVIAFVLGTFIGILMGRSAYWGAFFRDPVVAILNMPGVVLILVSLMLFALSPWGRIMALVLGIAPIVIINVAEGVRAIPRDLLDMAVAFEVGPYRRLRHVILPAAAPFVFQGARYGLGLGFKAAALIEVFGGTAGMGFQLRSEFIAFSVSGTLAWTALIIVNVMILERIILANIERRFFRWRQAAFS
jgi:NitT/TauT family transport system permease protein